MGLRSILAISCSLPGLLLIWILYQEYATVSPPVIETNAKMRIRMCREHIGVATANPDDALARQAVEECVVAGYVTRADATTALD